MSSPLRTATTIFLVFVAAAGGVLLFMNAKPTDGGGGSKSAQHGGSKEPAKQQGATSDIWKVGDTWTVLVKQDAGAITPDGDSSVVKVPFRFKVVSAPEEATGSWKVHVAQDGAEGPFAAGWNMEYRLKGDAMVLYRVSVGSEPPLEAELASIVLGPQFPYEVRYTAPPKDQTLDAKALLDRSLTPPSSLPSDAKATPGATPPAEAPKLSEGGEPVTR